MAILEDITNAITEGLGIEDDPKSFRPTWGEAETAADPLPVDQVTLPKTYEPEADPQYEAISFAVPDFGPIDFSFGDDDDFYSNPSEEELHTRRELELDRMAVQQSTEGTLAAPADPDAVADEYLGMLQKMENAQQKGKQTGQGGASKFFPFEALEGKGPDASIFSKYEIGYGNKIPEEWLSDKPEKWPVIDGVPVNVKDGLTDRQAQSLMQKSLDSAAKAVSTKLKGYDDMTAWEKQYWIDLAYNGGHGVVKRNPKAAKAAKQGYTAESLIRTFDYIGGGGAKLRGLLNRRLNMFNNASSEISGLPAVEEYSWGPEGVKVKFAAEITTDKVSKRFRDRINKADGWYTVTSGAKIDSEKQETFSLDDQFQFN